KVAVKNIAMNVITVFIESDFLLKESKLKFDPFYINGQDLDMWSQLILSPYLDKIGYLDIPLAIYRYYNSKWTKHPKREYYLYSWTSKFVNQVSNYKYLMRKSYLAEAVWNKGWLFNEQKKYRKYFFTKALTLHPWRIKYWKSYFGLLLKR
ncbi:hypothetical protein ACFL2I_05590, partial [Candidatus Omnitrophota bacterium]